MFLQEWLFRTALAEVGIDLTDHKIFIDHMNGVQHVGKTRISLKYPKDYLNRANEIPLERKYRYVFSGNMSGPGGRRELLAPFEGPDTFIEAENIGRNKILKYKFNESYYKLMRSGYFALCPHQKNWKGPPATSWTYRFVEACFSRILPVVFREAPCGPEFLKGFEYYWDNDIHNLEEYDKKIEKNYELVQKRFFLNADEIEKIQEEISALPPLSGPG